MESNNAPTRSEQLRGFLPVLALGAVCLVLSSLDQCTRGPSITAMVLTHLNTIL